MMRNTFLRTAMAALLGLGLAGGGIAAAQHAPTASASQQQPDHEHGQAPETKAPQPGMMQQHSQMMETMRASDVHLRELAAKMQTARGQARVDVMAELIDALVTDRSLAHAQMLQHHESMMAQMTAMMGAGMKQKMNQMQDNSEPLTPQTPTPNR